MTRRAILLVPGFGRSERFAARDRLVQSLTFYSDGWETLVKDSPSADGMGVATLAATGRAGEAPVTLDIYEAYWGDLVPDWAGESPAARFRRGTSLIGYWMTGGLIRAAMRFDMPSRTFLAMIVAAAALLFWYAAIFFLLVKAITQGEVTPAPWLNSLVPGIALGDALQTTAQWINNWPLSTLLLGLPMLGIIERFANVSAYTRAYLRDDAIGDTTVGLRSRTAKRVVGQLDQIFARAEADAYDEVYVVAHSLGGAIAVDALADYGTRLSKITLLTWGTALGTLAQREPMIEDKIRKFYLGPTPLAHWVDVVFSGDVMGSVAPIPRQAQSKKRLAPRMAPRFADTVVPPRPKGTGLDMTRIHAGYYNSAEAITMLVLPHAVLTKRFPARGATPDPATTEPEPKTPAAPDVRLAKVTQLGTTTPPR